ncbi:hypothetical protein ACFL5T_02790, partial [Gemmatimonadota bacterium]
SLRGGSTAWGTVYARVWSADGFATGVATGTSVVKPDEYVGSAIATSDAGRVIQCEYVTNTSRTDPHGQGACVDNKGAVYKLMY